ncbi:cyclic-guanylate-specific phosphodiesterase [Escherichia albertii]|uniref:cyclic-guanylate-specific phosphodiesterase n=1 Tax=Escherichia albertii TaxID=208962 RepID=UPI00211A96E5|nr:cyclic-guanylate-specific phosphodiesterase [Escherichia albertii]MCQ8930121.1 cyclic-guanylate-specific phosphodiesterase [Escherichia albertii]MCQ8965176.1 cyclic-guanylate-specific phosphodiesterase [Escherichia albertii]UUK97675.1 cyclic-guanylate-specific phosphodiesterase [Escherichia albertii]
MIRQVIQRISNPEASIESLQERSFWLQCELAYTWQPIYQVSGRLMAVELLTVVTHPDNPSQRLPPDRYFAEITISHRMDVVRAQVELLAKKADFFAQHDLLASVNIDGPTLIALRQQPEILRLIECLPWLRFELVEHIRLPKGSTFASICEFGPLWLDDFGTGMANFSALSEVRYDYIKIARELFVMLRQSPEGRTLFSQLMHLMNRYCRGVIVEGVETEEEWSDVQNSPAFAAQGWFLSRPAPIETLDTVVLAL